MNAQAQAKEQRILSALGGTTEGWEFLGYKTESKISNSQLTNSPLKNGVLIGKGERVIFCGKGEVRKYLPNVKLGKSYQTFTPKNQKDYSKPDDK